MDAPKETNRALPHGLELLPLLFAALVVLVIAILSYHGVHKALREGRAVGLANHTMLTAKDGRQTPIDDSAAPIRSADGKVLGVVLVFRDVTERKEAEKAARKSLEHFELMADKAPVMVWMAGLDKMRTWFNKPWLDFVGRPVERERGEGWVDNVHPEDRVRYLTTYAASFEARKPFRVEYRLRRHDGEYRWVLAHGAPLHDGAFTGFIGSCIDITDRRLLEEAAQRSEKTYRAIGESISYGVWICDRDGRNIYASDSFLQLVGMTQEQCADFGWGSVLHPDDADRTIAAWKECVAAGANWNIEHRSRGRDGRYHWILARGVPIRDESGAILRWAGINLDLDQVKAVEENLRANERELRAANEALMRANEDLNQFAFAASHDLQEPLRMITSYSQLLVKGYRGKLDEEASMYVNFVTQGAQRMRDLLADLLAYTQVNADGHEPDSPVDLNLTFEKAVANLRAMIEDSQAIVTQGPLPHVRGAEAHFLQLFQNLIGNAIKYRQDDPPKIHVSATKMQGQWCVAVKDNGIGIDPEYHQKVFGVFKRLHGKTIPGTGIGLAICQRVVERYGGKIWVESAVNQGSTFNFTLPTGAEERR